jgi:hypothetical protein
MSSLHSQIQYTPWINTIVKRDKILRMIGKTRATQNMSTSVKKRIALSIMSSPLQKMSIGAKQYAMANALVEAQKAVKVQPIGYFVSELDEERAPKRHITWGNVETKLVSYDIPIILEKECKENKSNTNVCNEKDTTITTERNMKIEQINKINRNIKCLFGEDA